MNQSLNASSKTGIPSRNGRLLEIKVRCETRCNHLGVVLNDHVGDTLFRYAKCEVKPFADTQVSAWRNHSLVDRSLAGKI